jgi:hypothetical protein
MRVFTFTDSSGTDVEMVEIELSEGKFIQMTKAHYEAQQVEQSTLVTESAPTA